MSLELKLVALAQAIGADVKALKLVDGDLSSLPTTNKASLVAAITEIHGLLGSGGAIIDDNAGNGDTDVVWSADKVFDTVTAAIAALKDDLLGGVGSAFDTLKELADALGSDPNFATTIAEGLNNRVRFDAAQTLNSTQRAQACANIGVGDPEHDFVADYNTAKA